MQDEIQAAMQEEIQAAMEQKLKDAVTASRVVEKEREAGCTDAEIAHLATIRQRVFNMMTMAPTKRANGRQFAENCEVFLDSVDRDTHRKTEKWIFARHLPSGKFITYEFYLSTDTWDVSTWYNQYTSCIRDEPNGRPWGVTYDEEGRVANFYNDENGERKYDDHGEFGSSYTIREGHSCRDPYIKVFLLA